MFLETINNQHKSLESLQTFLLPFNPSIIHHPSIDMFVLSRISLLETKMHHIFVSVLSYGSLTYKHPATLGCCTKAIHNHPTIMGWCVKEMNSHATHTHPTTMGWADLGTHSLLPPNPHPLWNTPTHPRTETQTPPPPDHRNRIKIQTFLLPFNPSIIHHPSTDMFVLSRISLLETKMHHIFVSVLSYGSLTYKHPATLGCCTKAIHNHPTIMGWCVKEMNSHATHTHPTTMGWADLGTRSLLPHNPPHPLWNTPPIPGPKLKLLLPQITATGSKCKTTTT